VPPPVGHVGERSGSGRVVLGQVVHAVGGCGDPEEIHEQNVYKSCFSPMSSMSKPHSERGGSQVLTSAPVYFVYDLLR